MLSNGTMARKKSSNGFTKQELFQNKIRHLGNTIDDEDIYFEMEFPPTTDSGNHSMSSKSGDSYRSDTPESRSQELQYKNISSRESSEGPKRPTTLLIHGVSTQPKGDKAAHSQSLHSAKHCRVPKMLHNMSHSTNSADLWRRDKLNVEHSKTNTRQLSCSVSSMEEDKEDIVIPVSGAKSRVSLDNFHFDSPQIGSSSDSPCHSSRSIPSFFKTSFSKLISIKAKTPEPTSGPRSLPSFVSVLANSRSASRATSPQLNDEKIMEDNYTEKSSPSPTPTTKNFVEESLAKGLPIIPFNCPTFVIVERRREGSIHKWKTTDQEEEISEHISDLSIKRCDVGVVDPNLIKEIRKTASAPASRKVSEMEIHEKQNEEDVEELDNQNDTKIQEEVEDKSLQTVLTQAKLQIEQEDLLKTPKLKKLSWIRGYAANNSRALERRRSSMTGYVQAMQQVCCKGIGKITNQGVNKSKSNTCTTPPPTKESIEQSDFQYSDENNLVKYEPGPKEVESTKVLTKVEDPGYIDMDCGSKVVDTVDSG